MKSIKITLNTKILLLAISVVIFEILIIVIMCKMKGWC